MCEIFGVRNGCAEFWVCGILDVRDFWCAKWMCGILDVRDFGCAKFRCAEYGCAKNGCARFGYVRFYMYVLFNEFISHKSENLQFQATRVPRFNSAAYLLSWCAENSTLYSTT